MGPRGWLERTSGGSGTWRVGGRRSGSRRAAKVSSDAGAIGIDLVLLELPSQWPPQWDSMKFKRMNDFSIRFAWPPNETP